MSDPIAAITDKLDRADDQFQKVQRLIRAYFDSDVCRYRGEYDPNEHRHSIESNISFPGIRLATRVGELVHDLRSALDHLAWRLVKEHGGTPGQNTYFPILKYPPAKGLRVVGGVSKDALALIERAQPYWPGLNFTPRLANDWDPLWVLHRMSIIDKHQEIPIHGIAIDHFEGFWHSDTTPAFTWTSELVSADERRARLRVVPDDPSVNMNATFSVFVVVHEPPRRPPVLTDTLGSALRTIRGIVDEARSTCFHPQP